MIHATDVRDWNMGCECQHCDHARELFYSSGMDYQEYFEKYPVSTYIGPYNLQGTKEKIIEVLQQMIEDVSEITQEDLDRK